MKKTTLLMLAVLFSITLLAQNKYPVQGVYKQVAIEAVGKKLTDIPVHTYRVCTGDKSLILWVQPNQGLSANNTVEWRMETMADPNDPFGTKIKKDGSDAFILTWFNYFNDFYNFPSGIWIDETWKKVTDDDIVKRISAVGSNNDAKGKMQGTWTKVAIQAPDIKGDTLFLAKNQYKIYGKTDCMMFNGSLYNIEEGGMFMLRPIQWLSDSEFIEDGVKHKVEIVSPSVMKLEYISRNNERMVETWIRYNIPAPLANVLKSIKL